MRKKAQFGQVISGYVDPTPEGLDKAYQRHMDNLMNSEAIRQEAAKLKAAPFEGDQQLRRELLTTSDKALQAIVGKASYGNLSNFTSAVNRASTEFQKKAAPISQNQQLYTAYQTTVGDLLEKGKIDAEDASGNILLSTMGYKGLSYDENGEATGYFSGKTVYQNPGIQDMINKALSNVEPDSWKEVRKVLGAGPDGSLTVETEQGEKYISADKVSAALAGVTNDPAVIGYYTRKGQIRTAMKKDKEVVGEIGGMIKVQADRADAARSAMANAKTPEEKAALQNRIDQATKTAGDLQSMVEGGKIDDMRSKLVQAQRDQLINTPIMAAINAKTSMNVVDSSKQGYDQKWMAQYKQRLKDASESTALKIRDNAITYNRLGGEDAGDLYVKIEEADTTLSSLMETYNSPEFNTMSQEGKMEFAQQVRDATRESDMMHNLFMDLYKTSPEVVFDTDEYRELQSRIESLTTISPVTATSASQFRMEEGAALTRTMKLNAAKRELRDYMSNLNLESPVGGTTARTVQFVDPTSLGADPNVNKEIKNHFSAGFSPMQMVINRDTGELIPLEELLQTEEFDGVEGISDLKYANHGISEGATLATGPLMRIGMSTSKGARSIIIPVGPSSQQEIPSLNEYYNGFGGSIINEFLTYQVEGMETIDEVPWYSKNDPSQRGTISADLTTAEGGTVTITDPAGKKHKMGLRSAELQTKLNDHKITLR